MATEDDNPKLHIVYMGSLPNKRPYSPTSHHLNLLQQVVDDGRSNSANYSLIHSYKRSFNGFAAMLSNQQREKLAQMEGVISVFPSKTLQLHTTKSWDFMGFPQSTKRSQLVESDVVVGLLDTGIWPESESFNDQGFGPIPKKWKGTCAGGKNFTCNKKIVGARFYDAMSARDTDGHGSHTASTVAGNQVANVSFYGLAQGTARGGVPSARVAMYKVCDEDCSEANVLAAFDDAIADGVDIISISMGTDIAQDFDQDVIAIGAFHALEKGVLTVQSAGNDGPSPRSITSVAPWLLTVAANTIDRQIIDKLVLGNGVTLTGKAVNGFTSNGTQFSISTKDDDVNGKILLLGYSDNEDMALPNGAVGAVKGVDIEDYIPMVSPLPFVALYLNDYAILESYAKSTKDPRGEILKSEVIGDQTAPIVAEFSSRGPNVKVIEILKPDISAPGVNILAAFSPTASPSGVPADERSVQYNLLSGTSMSCPHAAGIAAYVRTFHLDWSPAAIKSAIMTSTLPMNASSKDQIGEYAYGSGQLNPVQAVNPGLVYDIGKEDYIKMFCHLGYDHDKIKAITGENIGCFGAPDRSLVRNLNYPALVVEVQPRASFSVRFNRTVTNVGLANSSYRAIVLPNPDINAIVAPQVLSFKSLNEKRSFVVTVTGRKLPTKLVLTSSLIWSDGTHNVRSPIVVNVS